MKLTTDHSLVRQVLFPVYGIDQFAYVLLIPALSETVCLAIADHGPLLLMMIFGYVGYVYSMFRSTPSTLVMSSSEAPKIIKWLDSSRYLMRSGENKWMQRKPRALRWNTDTLILEEKGAKVVLHGRFIDLFKAKSLFDTNQNLHE